MTTFEKIFFMVVVASAIIFGNHVRNPSLEGALTVSLSSGSGAAAYVRKEAPPFVFSVPLVVQSIPETTQTVLAKPVIKSQPLAMPQVAVSNAALTANVSIAPTVFVKETQASVPDIHAKIVSVSDLASGEEYMNLNSEKQWPLASITKLVTAVQALRGLDLKQFYTLTDQAFVEPDNSTTKNLKIGDTYGGFDLLRAMLLLSSNEAAETFANYYGRLNFIAGMNNAVLDWGAASTNFVDPTGLSPSNQSTAEDLKKIALRIYKDYPEVFRITRESSYVITEDNSNRKVTIQNIDSLSEHPDFLGGKTGYTNEAIGNLLTIFSFEGRSVLFIVLGTDDRFGDTQKLVSWFGDNFVLRK